jgi:ABC-type nickel/cobalt efflux system permease component RcnA
MTFVLFGVIIGMLMTLVVYGAWIFVIAFMVWMAVDAAKQDRFWWVVLIIGIPFIGSAAYFFTEKKHEYAKAEPHHIHTSETEEQHERAPRKRKSHKHEETIAAAVTEHHEEHAHEAKHEHKEDAEGVVATEEIAPVEEEKKESA